MFVPFVEPPDGITPTIGFANAEFTINKCKVTAYDLGGGVRIRDVWRKYYAEVSKEILRFPSSYFSGWLRKCSPSAQVLVFKWPFHKIQIQSN